MIHNTFYIHCDWPARPETAKQIASRLETYLTHLSKLHPTLSLWAVGKRHVPYACDFHDLSEAVAHDVVRAEDGDIIPSGGHRVSALSLNEQQHFALYGGVGADFPWPGWNDLDLSTWDGREIDMSIVTYDLLKAATLGMIECWEPIVCEVRSNKLDPKFETEGWYVKSWMTYVRPQTADSVDLTGIPLVERTSDGGLLLSATTDLFDPANLAHLGAAQRISDTLQPLNADLPDLSPGWHKRLFAAMRANRAT